MLNWGSLDPARFERAVQQLLQSQHPGLVSLDGAGGDGGRDAQLHTADGTVFFEMKSFNSRLNNGRRRKIETSLSNAMKSLPGLKEWFLVIPLNPTKGELAWFQGKLQEIAGPDVRLTWRGRDWLDVQAAESPAFARYVEGPQAELLKMASELGFEQAALMNGSVDLFKRNDVLRRRVDELSMHWTTDWAVEGSAQRFTLRAKHPDAHLVDPIKFVPTFRFEPDNENAIATRAALINVLEYCGSIDIPATFLQDFAIDTSDATKQLFANFPGNPAVGIHGEEIPFDKPLRGKLIVEALDGTSATLDVRFRSRTSGTAGITLIGNDECELTNVRFKLPFDKTSPASSEASFNINFRDPWDSPVADIIDIFAFQSALQTGGRLIIEVGGHTRAGTDLEPQPNDPVDMAALTRAATVIHQLEQHLKLILRMPSGFTRPQLELAEAIVSTFDGHNAQAPFDEITVDVVPGQVEVFLTQFADEPFALHFGADNYPLIVGDVTVGVGPILIEMSASVVANRDELLANPAAEKPVAKLRASDGAAHLLSHQTAVDYAKAQLGGAH